MAAFKLPRLKANLAIVDGQGRPLGYFLRLFNIELAGRIEASITDLVQVQQELADQLAMILAAQATADAALALAESAQGARYIDIDGPYPSVSGIINGQSADSILTYSGSVSGATLDADSSWVGVATFTESTGGPAVVIGTVPVTIASNGDEVAGQWQTDPVNIDFSGVGTLSGNVTYSISLSYSSGANLITFPDISFRLTTIPMAT